MYEYNALDFEMAVYAALQTLDYETQDHVQAVMRDYLTYECSDETKELVDELFEVDWDEVEEEEEEVEPPSMRFAMLEVDWDD